MSHDAKILTFRRSPGSRLFSPCCDATREFGWTYIYRDPTRNQDARYEAGEIAFTAAIHGLDVCYVG